MLEVYESGTRLRSQQGIGGPRRTRTAADPRRGGDAGMSETTIVAIPLEQLYFCESCQVGCNSAIQCPICANGKHLMSLAVLLGGRTDLQELPPASEAVQ